MRTIVSIIVATWACVLPCIAGGAPADPVALFPDSVSVLADVRGRNEEDRLVRQLASLAVLQDALIALHMSPRTKGLWPSANLRFKQYATATEQLWATVPRYDTMCKQAFIDKLNPLARCDKTVLVETIGGHRRSEAFAREVLGRYLPPVDVDRFVSTTTSLTVKAAPRASPTWIDGYVDRFDEPLRTSASIALLSVGWLLPAALIFGFLALDRAETRTKSITLHGPDGGTYRGTLTEPTGRTRPGDPEFAGFVALLWTLAMPPLTLCLLLALDRHVPLLLKIVLPFVTLFITLKLTRTMIEADDDSWGGLLRRAWLGLLGLASIHAFGWLGYLLYLWLG